MSDDIEFCGLHVALTILVVEDEAPDTALVGAKVKSLWPDSSLLFATSLHQAQQIYEANDIDVVLLDLNLPDSMGLNTVREMRHSVSCPLIVMTGILTDIIADEALKAGASAVVSKTEVMSDDFYAVLEHHVGS